MSKRKSNWSSKELQLLVDSCSTITVISAKLSASVTAAHKNTFWENCTERVNSVGVCGNRTKEEVKKKWTDTKPTTKRKAQVYRKESRQTGGGPAPSPLKDWEEKLPSSIRYHGIMDDGDLFQETLDKDNSSANHCAANKENDEPTELLVPAKENGYSEYKKRKHTVRMLPKPGEIRLALCELLPEHEAYLDTHVFRHFLLDDEVLVQVRDLLDANISHSLDPATKHKSPLDIGTSYITESLVPDGTETGTCLSLDLGGTNLRVLMVTFGGEQLKKQMTHRSIPTEVLSGSSTELFDFIADVLHTFLQEHYPENTKEPIPLGFSFSYPVTQTALNIAYLQKWTKDFACNDAIGQDVGRLLKEAIIRKGDMNVDCVAIMNDTLATLAAGTLQDHSCSVAVICGTGTNGSFLQSGRQLGEQANPGTSMVALEARWNNFGNDGQTDFIRSEYDLEVTKNSTHPFEMIFEKMMCGMFIGEIVRLVLCKMFSERVCFHNNWSKQLETPGSFTTQYVSKVLRSQDGVTAADVLHSLGLHQPSHTERMVLYHVCQLVTFRAACLTAACTSALVNRVDRPQVPVAVDGSFYFGNSLLHEVLFDTMKRLVNPNIKFYFVPCEDGSGIGAAVIAATVNKLRNR